MALSGLPGAPEGCPDCPGVRCCLRASLPAGRPALPRPTFRGLHPSAVFPIKAGIPGWVQTKRDRGKSTPRANQTLVYFTRVRLGSEMSANPRYAGCPCKVSSRKKKKMKAHQNERNFTLLPVLSLWLCLYQSTRPYTTLENSLAVRLPFLSPDPKWKAPLLFSSTLHPFKVKNSKSLRNPPTCTTHSLSALDGKKL